MALLNQILALLGLLAGSGKFWALVFDGTRLFFGASCTPAKTVDGVWRSAKLYAGGPTAEDSEKTYDLHAVMVAPMMSKSSPRHAVTATVTAFDPRNCRSIRPRW